MVKRWVIIVINPEVWVDFAWIVERTGKNQKLCITNLLGLPLFGKEMNYGIHVTLLITPPPPLRHLSTVPLPPLYP